MNRGVPDEVSDRDAEMVYGALTHHYFREETVTPEELRPFHTWGDYLEDCLDHLVEEYDGVREEGGEYWIEELEQEKHLERVGQE